MGRILHRGLGRRACRAAFGPIAALALTSACASREPLPVDPGVSKVPILVSAQRFAADAGSSRWERADEISGYRQVGKAFVSRGHFAGRWRVQIAVNDIAAPTYGDLAPSSHFAAGSVLVKTHFDAESGAAGPIFARIKREPGFFPGGDDWEYVALTASFQVEERGPLAFCARCHAEAVADGTFALPPEAE
jgi:hypothetical protein